MSKVINAWCENEVRRQGPGSSRFLKEALKFLGRHGMRLFWMHAYRNFPRVPIVWTTAKWHFNYANTDAPVVRVRRNLNANNWNRCNHLNSYYASHRVISLLSFPKKASSGLSGRLSQQDSPVLFRTFYAATRLPLNESRTKARYLHITRVNFS